MYNKKCFSVDIKQCLDYNLDSEIKSAGAIKSVTSLENDNQILVTMGSENYDTICLEIKENGGAQLYEVVSDFGRVIGNSKRFDGVGNEFSGKQLTVIV